MKKAVSLLLLAALLFGAAFGCNAAREGAAEASLEPTAEPTAEPSAEPVYEIRTGKHEREEGYPNPFRTHYIETDVAVMHMEDAIYTESVLREAERTVAADMETIADTLGETPDKVMVYLVQRMDRPTLLNGHVVCTVDDLRSGAYREALCGACYGLSAPWKQIGLSAYVFGTIDESGLFEYYADEAHALTASCAAMFLLDGFADEATVQAARKTAQSMTLYLLNNGGLTALKSIASTAEILRGWQAALGIETPLSLPEGSEYVGSVTAKSDAVYRCIVRKDNFSFRLEKDSFTDTPDDLYRFLCAYFSGAEIVLDRIRTELPGYAAIAEERFSSPIAVVLMPERVGRSGTSSPERTDLHTGYVAPHELVHMLLWTDTSERMRDELPRLWQNEAIAEHFSLEAITRAFPEPEFDGFETFINDLFSEEWATDPDYCTALWNVYCAEKAENAIAENNMRDEYAWQTAIGVCGLLFENDPLEAPERTVAGMYGFKPEDADGFGLTYEEAMIVMEYLFDRFGTETVVDAYMNKVPFAEAFGIDYETLFNNCVAYLKEKYGELLPDADRE